MSTVDCCDVCGEVLSDVPCSHQEPRSKIDIVPAKVVEHVGAEIKQCSNCNATIKGQIPLDMHDLLQYCCGLKALVSRVNEIVRIGYN